MATDKSVAIDGSAPRLKDQKTCSVGFLWPWNIAAIKLNDGQRKGEEADFPRKSGFSIPIFQVSGRYYTEECIFRRNHVLRSVVRSMPDNRPTRDETFARLFGLNQGRVFAYIVTLLPHWADAEDVLQRTSIVLWKKMDQFDPSGDFVRWACGVAYRETLKYLKQQNRRRQVFNEAVLSRIAQARVVRSDLLEMRHFAMGGCVEKLPLDDREIIEHYYFRGKKTVAEVAKELGRPVNTVYKALVRIRGSLHRCIDDAVSSENRK